MDIAESKAISSPGLVGVKETVDLSKQEKLNDSNSSATVKNTFSEISREGKALVLDKDSTDKATKYQTKSRTHLQKYLSAKEKIDRFARSLQQNQSRRKRRAASEKQNYPNLTQEERSALLEMYKLFEELDKEKEGLSPRLYELDKSAPRTIAVKSRPNKSEIESNLKKMKWSSQSEVEYTTERPGGYGKSNIPNSWLDWDKNPYKLFLGDSTEYTSLMSKMEKVKKDKENYLKNNRGWGVLGMLMGPGTVRSTYSKSGEYDRRVGDARADFANKVALKMLTWMGQNKKTGKI